LESDSAPGLRVEAAAPCRCGHLCGSEACKGCLEDQFKKMDTTPHARVSARREGPPSAQGCESCTGQGASILRTRRTPPSQSASARSPRSPWRPDGGCLQCHHAGSACSGRAASMRLGMSLHHLSLGKVSEVGRASSRHRTSSRSASMSRVSVASR